jgi:hypothetical protein
LLCGGDVAAAKASLARMEEVVRQKVAALQRLTLATNAVSEVLELLVETSQEALEAKLDELSGAIAQACSAGLDITVTSLLYDCYMTVT